MKQRLDRQKVIETAGYRKARAALVEAFGGAYSAVTSASAALIPLQSALVHASLFAALGDAVPRVQEAALYALAHIAMPGHEPTAVQVARCVGSADAGVQKAAALCLGAIACGMEAAVDVLLVLLVGKSEIGDGGGLWGAHESTAAMATAPQKLAALEALSLMLRAREPALTALRQKTMAALTLLQDLDGSVREAAKRLSGYIARGDDFGLEGFRCEPDVLAPLPPFLPSALVSYTPTAADSDKRPPYTKAHKRGAEPHSDMLASRALPSFNQVLVRTGRCCRPQLSITQRFGVDMKRCRAIGGRCFGRPCRGAHMAPATSILPFRTLASPRPRIGVWRRHFCQVCCSRPRPTYRRMACRQTMREGSAVRRQARPPPRRHPKHLVNRDPRRLA